MSASWWRRRYSGIGWRLMSSAGTLVILSLVLLVVINLDDEHSTQALIGLNGICAYNLWWSVSDVLLGWRTWQAEQAEQGP